MAEVEIVAPLAGQHAEPVGIALRICDALRENNMQDAKDAFVALLKVETTDSDFLRLTQEVLLYALRRHKQPLFVSWLQLADQRLQQIMVQTDLCDACNAWLQSIVFASCDRRLMLPFLERLVHLWLRVNVAQTIAVQKLFGELLGLAARMARRGWREETAWLLRLVITGAWHQHDSRRWRELLDKLVLHFIGYAKWDGFPNACVAYVELHYVLLLLVQRISSGRIAQEEKEELLRFVLRSVRTLIVNSARSTMQDDMEVFRQWYQFLHQQAGGSERRKKQFMQLLQLSILYWNATLPKSSRKQVRYLEDLLTPDYVGEYKILLDKIV